MRPSLVFALPGLGRVEVLDEDHHRALTVLAVTGLAAGVALAVFGMPPIDLHLPTHRLGLMSPTCGMTRGVAALLRGDAQSASAYNPASFLVVIGAGLALARFVVGLAARRWVTFYVDVTPAGWIVITAALIALWSNQQAHAELLMTG